MSNFITNAELRIEGERLCDENEKLREENEMLRNYRAEHEKDMAGCYEKNPDGLPVGLTISPDGTLLDWEGENYVLQSIVRDVEREPNGNMAGDGKCHVTQYDTGDDSMLCYGCSACGYGWHVSKNDKPFTYCPNCGREIVYPTIVMDEWDKDGHLVRSDLVAYDVLGNERHKAICELQKINVDKLCEQYDYIDVYAQYVWAIGEALGIEGGGGFESIIDRLIHLLGGDMQIDLVNLDKPCGDGDASTIHSTSRRREVVRRLKEYREHPPVRDMDGFIVEDTYSVSEVEGIVTGKELFTTGEFIDSLISLIDEHKEPTREIYTNLTVNTDKTTETPDAEDTRESLEEDVHV